MHDFYNDSHVTGLYPSGALFFQEETLGQRQIAFEESKNTAGARIRLEWQATVSLWAKRLKSQPCQWPQSPCGHGYFKDIS